MGGEGSGVKRGASRGPYQKKAKPDNTAPVRTPWQIAEDEKAERKRKRELKEAQEAKEQEERDLAAAASARVAGPPPAAVALPPGVAGGVSAGIVQALGNGGADVDWLAKQFAGVFTTQLHTQFSAEMESMQKLCRAAYAEQAESVRREYQGQLAEMERVARDARSAADALETQVAAANDAVAGRAALRGLEAHAKHTCVTPDGRVFCYTCSKHWKEVALDGRSTGSKWLKGASNPLRDTDDAKALRAAAASHFGGDGRDVCTLHKRCVEREEDSTRQTVLNAVFSAQELREEKAMANLFRIVLSMAKRHDALQTYESSVDLADLNGVEVGQREHSRFTARSMARVAAAKGRSQVKVFLERAHQPVDELPHGLGWAGRRRCALDELEEGPFRRVVLEQFDRGELLRDAGRLGRDEVQEVRLEDGALVLLEAVDVRVVVAGPGRGEGRFRRLDEDAQERLHLAHLLQEYDELLCVVRPIF
ncbi:hypothetical protein AURANDRAFT_66215 [Aureococcus anophagefferens]|uniref:Uncharacterized protein n=1 Tax=Aureococcus anophagefferens TaxID=44056 RepID=F0YGS1_AURAN|nr:hypothetical protein AURANDRAFT_66215 [Aureococcus anophagefferens]EGB05753.1 hypothetical protein AURANDRAFT_66215 [Aureococcus anophagefferens]|eukprot:XP_009039592.1 hypothetical protein AURANDRAFT_66215 [Aureococcus anophagefferens]